MSIDMYVKASQEQASSFSTYCKKQTQGYQQIQKAINSFVLTAPFLTGKAYDSAKAFHSSVLYPLSKGAELLIEASEEAVSKFPEEYMARVDSGDLREEDLEYKIQKLNQQIGHMEQIRQLIDSSKLSDLTKSFQLLSNRGMTTLLVATKEKLEEKLAKLREFHATSPQIFSEIDFLQQAVDKGLAQTKTAWDGTTGTFVIPKDLSWAKTIQDAPYIKIVKEKYKKHLEKYPEDMDKLIAIVRYEESHPEYVKSTDEFLSPMELKDQIEIKYMIYTAESPYNILCLKYMDKFKIVDINKSGVFNSGDNTLVFNVKEDRINPRGKYYTFFHEMGHAIDFYYAKEDRNFIENLFNGDFFSDKFIYKEKKLSEYNYLDVGNNLELSMRELLNGKEYNDLSAKEKQKIIDNVSGNLLNQNRNRSKFTNEEKDIQQLIITDFNAKLDGATNEPAADVYGGITNLTIDTGYGHHGKNKDGSTYWFTEKGEVIRTTNHENFAEYFGREMVADPEHTAGLNSMDKYLPKSKDCLGEMIKEMGRGN